MRSTILGIFVVLCLQFGFIVYSSVEGPLDPLVAVNEIPMASIANADVPETGDIADFLDTNTDREFTADIVAASAKPRVDRRLSGNRRSNKNIVDPTPGSVDLEPVVIAYRKLPAVEFRTGSPQSLAVSNKPANYELSAKPAPRPEKRRSFLSKSAAVLKKPYNWLKAVGSLID